MEQLYPMEDGRSMFAQDPKLRAELEKELKKGNIRAPDLSKPQDVDDDQDAKIDGVIQEIWSYYDKKNAQALDKV
jgi:hypothetical protein